MEDYDQSRPWDYESARRLIAEHNLSVTEEQWAKIVATFDPKNTGAFSESFNYMIQDQRWVSGRVQRRNEEVEKVSKLVGYVEHIAEKYAGQTGKDTEHNVHVNIGDQNIVNTRLHATFHIGKVADDKFKEISKGLFEGNPEGIMVEIPCENPEEFKKKVDPFFRLLERIFYVELPNARDVKFDCKAEAKSLKAWTIGLPDEIKRYLPIAEKILAAIFGDSSASIDINATTKASAKTIHHNDMVKCNRRALIDHFIEGSTVKANIKIPGKIKPAIAHFLTRERGPLNFLLPLLSLNSTIELDLDDLNRIGFTADSRSTYSRIIKEIRIGREIENAPKVIREVLEALVDQGHSELHANVFIKEVMLSICLNTENLSSVFNDLMLAGHLNDDYYGGSNQDVKEKQQRTEEDIAKLWTKQPRAGEVLYCTVLPERNYDEKEETTRLL